MSLFDIFKDNSLQKKTAAFYKNNNIIPDFGAIEVAPRSASQIFTFFSKHPGWGQLPNDLLTELSTRVADRSRNWAIYDTDHALEIVVFATERTNALIHNFIPICRDNEPPMDTPAARLYLFAMTFEQLANKFLREVMENRDRISKDAMIKGIEDAKAFAEATLICDRYFLSSFMPAAWGWLLKDDNTEMAVSILDEAIQWANDMGTVRPHITSMFDEQFISMSNDHINILEETKRNILEME